MQWDKSINNASQTHHASGYYSSGPFADLGEEEEGARVKEKRERER